MAKSLPIDQQLSALTLVRADPKCESSKVQLLAALASKSSLVAAKAASIICDSHQVEFLPQLSKAFDRFFVDGSDKGCPAKTALAKALYELGHNESAGFLRGIHHVQLEASFGPSVDVAAELRGLCGLGLARMGYPDILLELAELLVDPEPQPRQIAARAIAYTGSPDGAPLLRMKILCGDVQPEITAECFVALMKLSPKKSLGFVARFLDSADSSLIESAATAIGESRTPDAFELLQRRWESHLTPDTRRPFLVGIALTRQAAAIEFMIERIVEDRPGPAADAVLAMAIYRHDEAIKQRISDAVNDRAESQVVDAFRKAFSPTA